MFMNEFYLEVTSYLKATFKIRGKGYWARCEGDDEQIKQNKSRKERKK